MPWKETAWFGRRPWYTVSRQAGASSVSSSSTSARPSREQSVTRGVLLIHLVVRVLLKVIVTRRHHQHGKQVRQSWTSQKHLYKHTRQLWSSVHLYCYAEHDTGAAKLQMPITSESAVSVFTLNSVQFWPVFGIKPQFQFLGSSAKTVVFERFFF